MRATRAKVYSITAILLGGVLAFFAIESSPKQTLTLSDGTILRLERIDYGKKRPFRLDAWRARFQWVIGHLPAWLPRQIGRAHV